MTKRAYALDALRGYAIITMVLSATVAWNSLPGWMYHAQTPPPDRAFDASLSGITWVDLVFPFFLFAMGAAFPFSIKKRFEKGDTKLRLVYEAIKRGAQLTFFAIFIQHFYPHVLSNPQDMRGWLLAILCFVILFPMFIRIPLKMPDWMRIAIKVVAYGIAIVLLLTTQYANGRVFDVSFSNIIILLLANMAVFGSAIYIFTMQSLWARVGVLLILMVLLLSGQVENSWAQAIYNYTPLPWAFHFEYLQYLFIVIPGSIAGEYLMDWLKQHNDSFVESTNKWKAIVMIASGILSLIVIVLLLSNMLNYVQKVERADRAVKICIIDVNSAARSIREMALNTDKSSYNTYESDVKDILNNVNSELLILKGLNTVDTDLYNQYSKALNDWGTIGYSIIKEIKAGNITAATNDILNKCTPALDNVISIGDKLDADTDVTRNTAIWFTFFYAIAGIAAIIIFVIVAIVISKKTSKNIVNSIMLPLGEIEKVAAELTQGNLHSQLDYHSDDEIGQLAHNLRKSIRILSSYVDDIGHSMKEFSKGNFAVQPEVEWKGDFVDILNSFVAFENSMSDTVIGIQRAANEVSGGAGQVAESSNDLAQGATDQAAVVEELTASITNVAEQIDKNAESTKNISTSVDNLGKEIVTSNARMQDMVESMNEINEASQQIDQIIATINEIASRTRHCTRWGIEPTA